MKQCKLVIKDEVNIQFVGLDPVTRRKLVDSVKFFLPYARHLPQYKLGRWDGTISFCDTAGRSYLNLLEKLLPIVYDAHYEVEIEDCRTAVDINFSEIESTSYSHVKWPKGHPAEGQGIVLKDHQVELVNSFLNNIQGINICPTSGGKAQPLYSKILTPLGWKTMNDMEVGSQVINKSGTVSTVIGVYPQGEKDIYRLYFEDGRHADSTIDHLWNIRKRGDLNWSTATLKDVRKMLSNKGRTRMKLPVYEIPLANRLKSTIDILLPCDPWTAGYLLASVKVAGKNLIIKELNPVIINKLNETLDTKLVKLDLYTYQIDNPNSAMMQFIFGNELSSVRNIKLPEIFFASSVKQKIQLVRGLFDASAFATKISNTVKFLTDSVYLLSDLQKLMWELGSVCINTSTNHGITVPGKKRQQVGSLTFTALVKDTDVHEYFTLASKKESVTKHYCTTQSIGLKISKIELIGKEEAQCIAIDSNDKLYITDNHIVTHNTICTAILSHQVEKYGRSILIVPNKDLVIQTTVDYKNLGLDVGQYFGDQHDIDKTHTICTWQSLEVLHKNKKSKNGKLEIDEFLNGVVAVIADETHRVKGEVLKKLLTGPFANVPIRWGLTGTMPDDEHEATAVISCIGPVHNKIKVKDLQDKGIVAELDIHVTQLVDSVHSSPFGNYAAEQKWLSTNKDRITFLAGFIRDKASDSGNTLVLVDRIETGKLLASMIPNSIFLSGSTKSTDRKKEYDSINDEENKVLIATAAIASTGISINRIFNLVLIEPGKSFVKVIQSIGRGLRVAKDKSRVDVYDICSDSKYSKSHLAKRKKFYKDAEYKYEVKKINY